MRKLLLAIAVLGVFAFPVTVAFADAGGTPNEHAAGDGVTGSEGVGNQDDCHGNNEVPCGEDPQPDHGNDCVRSDDHICTSPTITVTTTTTTPPPVVTTTTTTTATVPPPVETTTTPAPIPPVTVHNGGGGGGGKPIVAGKTVSKPAGPLAFTGSREDTVRFGALAVSLLSIGSLLLAAGRRKAVTR